MTETKKVYQRILLKDEIAHYYQHLFTYIPKKMHIILRSGRSTTKSTFLSIYDLWRLLQTPHADAVVIAYEYASIADKVFEDYKFAAQILHIPERQIEFYTSKNGETYIKVKNKWGVNKIWFRHAKMGSEGFKGMRPTVGNKWLYLRFYELTNFINWNARELSNTIATFIRDAYSNPIWSKIEAYCKEHCYECKHDTNWLIKQEWYGRDWYNFMTHEFCIEYEYNTPGVTDEQGGWVEDWEASKKQQDNVYWQFNNYLDMYDWEKFKFIKGETLKEIENMKLVDPVNYNFIYLGKKPYDGDVVFPMLNKQIHYGKQENFNPDLICIGVDVGTSDPTVITATGIEYRGKDLRVEIGLHRWSHGNKKMKFIKDGVLQHYKVWDINNYADMILEFCDMIHEEYPTHHIVFQMDRAGAGKDFYDMAFKYKDPSYLDVNRLWKKVDPDTRINALQTMMMVPGVLKINDPVTFEAYKNQIYDKRKREESGERKRLDDPARATLDMDSQDSAEYSIPSWLYPTILDRMRKNKGKFEGPFSPNITIHQY